MSKQIIVNDLYKGFHKVTDTKLNTFEYLRPEALERKIKKHNLSVVKVQNPTPVNQVGKSNQNNSNEKTLDKMNKLELGEVAIRYGFTGDLNDPAVTKSIIIKFIETEQAKS